MSSSSSLIPPSTLASTVKVTHVLIVFTHTTISSLASNVTVTHVLVVFTHTTVVTR